LEAGGVGGLLDDPAAFDVTYEQALTLRQQAEALCQALAILEMD
jgi:hypothetical protein